VLSARIQKYEGIFKDLAVEIDDLHKAADDGGHEIDDDGHDHSDSSSDSADYPCSDNIAQILQARQQEIGAIQTKPTILQEHDDLRSDSSRLNDSVDNLCSDNVDEREAKFVRKRKQPNKSSE